ncbi:4'-phosphopantetheinyl transferase family protein [Magnetospirillum molischianum]|uniref:4'-phosphopantetheinyl transferase family protein n=1 Tax=Magnetospirillum molischianum TaxID=1083 RepID=UPI0002E1DB11|nr:4'-phosphopantetheinyl transferase superfamily protein [Magnetospirillum molischianum]
MRTVRLYSLSLNGDTDIDSLWRDVLSPEERNRADRFRRIEDRHSFTAAHALTRMALAHDLDLCPQSLTFAAAPGGKPVLSSISAKIGFSLSHTDRHVAVAVATGDVGVDIENIRRPRLDAALAKTAFGAAKTAALGPDPASDSWRLSFFATWTACEAVLKADGAGLAVPMERIDIDGAQAILNGRRWNLWQRPLLPDHYLALAWEVASEVEHTMLDHASFSHWCTEARIEDGRNR